MKISSLLKEKRIIICVGSGGVGKTTVSASVALKAAQAGRKTLVCTIDPARRLADSLGLKELGNRESKISDEVFAKAGIKPKGELWGMMLDSKRTFDELIERIAPSPESRDKILTNQYYQNITSAMAGSQEFSAMEKLYELWTKSDYDLIVLDTPPTKHALDFLDAPNRLSTFLDGKVAQWFIKPYLMAGKMGFKFIHRGAGLMFKMLEKATGYQTMADLTEFFLAFEGMYDGFKERAAKVRELFSAPETGFLLVTSPQAIALSEAKFFLDKLMAEKMPLGSVVFNRFHFPLTDLTPERIAEIGEDALLTLPKYAPAVDNLVENLRSFSLLAGADDRAIEKFLDGAKGDFSVAKVPFMDHDVHDLAGLLEVSLFLD